MGRRISRHHKAYSLIYMLPLSAKIPFNWRELTPVSCPATGSRLRRAR
jgi:hypothetical protein